LINRADYQIGGGVALRLRTQDLPSLAVHKAAARPGHSIAVG
jgi:hypothetical protein